MENLKELLFIESFLRVLASLAPSDCISLQQRIDYTAAWLHERETFDKQLLQKERFVDNIFEKNDFSQIKRFKILNALFGGAGLEETWWADASSNALQLIVLTRGTNNKLLLQLLNLIENTTKHKNIYSYLAHQLRELDYTPIVASINDAFLQLIDTDLVKYIAMPAAYGKTLWSCKKTIKKNLTIKSAWWPTLDNSTQDKLCSLWYTSTFKILTTLGLDLKDHISRCKKSYDVACPVYSHFKIPIFTRTIKLLNRSLTLRKLKTKKLLLQELLQSFPNNKNYHGLTEVQLVLLLTQELAKLLPAERSAHSIQQALKLLKSIQAQKNLLLENNNYTRRVNVTIRQSIRIQFRIARLSNNLTDTQRSSAAIAPNITHAYDAAILLSTIESLRKLRIPCACIHDSIGCRLEHLPIVIFMYKYNLVCTVKEYYSNKSRYFPYTTSEPYNLANIHFPDELLNSTNLFY
jgi:hypothetical protein